MPCPDKEKEPTNRTIIRWEWGVMLAIALQTATAIWWASKINSEHNTMRSDVTYLLNEARKGGRYTLDRGELVETRVTQLEIFQAGVQKHVDLHEKNAEMWIRQIEENTRVSRENNAMLRALTSSLGIKNRAIER